MVEYIRAGLDDAFQGRPISLKIGDEHLDEGLRRNASNLLDRPGKSRCSTVRKVISGHRGDHRIPEAHFPDGSGNPFRFACIPPRLGPVSNGAKCAIARTRIAKDHKRCRSPREALELIRTLRFLADRGQTITFQKLSNLFVFRAGRQFTFEPMRFALSYGIVSLPLFRCHDSCQLQSCSVRCFFIAVFASSMDTVIPLSI